LPTLRGFADRRERPESLTIVILQDILVKKLNRKYHERQFKFYLNNDYVSHINVICWLVQ
jgi:hypothetical protein